MSLTYLGEILDNIVDKLKTITYIGDVYKGEPRNQEYLNKLPAVVVNYADEVKADYPTQSSDCNVEVRCQCYVPDELHGQGWTITGWWNVLEWLFSWIEYKLKYPDQGFRAANPRIISLTCQPYYGLTTDDVRGISGQGRMTLKIRYRHPKGSP